MKRTNAYESAGDSDDEFIDSSLSPRDSDYEHLTSRKKRRGVIEKRRRDRINHCLMELRRLVPQAISKEGSTKLEKAEILQMTVDHLRSIQSSNKDSFQAASWPVLDAHASGFRECVDEISRYLISVEGFDVQHPLRLRLLSHLECFTDRSLSPSSSSSITTTNLIDSDQSWPLVHQTSPSAFATPPLSSYPTSSMLVYSSHSSYHPQQHQHHHHHVPIQVHPQVTNSTFSMHHYPPPPPPPSSHQPHHHHHLQPPPPVDRSTSSSSSSSSTTAATCF